MYTLSKDCPWSKKQFAGGTGAVALKQLSGPEQMYGHARQFSHVVVEPGCSIGDHTHSHEVEFYYFLKGHCMYRDNGQEVHLHSGDVAAAGDGDCHGLLNCGSEPLEFIALVLLE